MADDDYLLSCSDSEECYSHEDDDTVEIVLEGLDEKPKVDGNWCSFSIITKESLLAEQMEDLQKVMELLAIREQHARTLLMYNRWNVERVSELLDRKGRERLLCEAGVVVTENKGLDLSKSSAPITCNICFEDVAPNAAAAMDCGHCYCNDCWTEHFIVQIKDGQGRHIRCMSPKCNTICDEAIIRNLVSEKNPDIADLFDRTLLESYIEDNNMVKWCPSIPHCGNAIRVEGGEYCEAECTCGLNFCFNCLLEAHSPCSCMMWKLWIEKCKDESETSNWIMVNTKHCPKCHKPVEKNGGCNLVTCVCGQHFCWLCGGTTGASHTWQSIAGHYCNRFKVKEKNVEIARRNIQRYLHYYTRYEAHTDSIKQKNKLMETIKERISLSENKESSVKDFSWVLDGLHRLFVSRSILSRSYPFAFYMFGDELFKDEIPLHERKIKQNLFENQQQQLELHVEKLSMLLQKEFQNFTDEEVIKTRMHIITLSGIVNNLCKEMYEFIENDLLYHLTSPVLIAPYKSGGL